MLLCNYHHYLCFVLKWATFFLYHLVMYPFNKYVLSACSVSSTVLVKGIRMSGWSDRRRLWHSVSFSLNWWHFCKDLKELLKWTTLTPRENVPGRGVAGRSPKGQAGRRVPGLLKAQGSPWDWSWMKEGCVVGLSQGCRSGWITQVNRGEQSVSGQHVVLHCQGDHEENSLTSCILHFYILRREDLLSSFFVFVLFLISKEVYQGVYLATTIWKGIFFPLIYKYVYQS